MLTMVDAVHSTVFTLTCNKNLSVIFVLYCNVFKLYLEQFIDRTTKTKVGLIMKSFIITYWRQKLRQTGEINIIINTHKLV